MDKKHPAALYLPDENGISSIKCAAKTHFVPL